MRQHSIANQRLGAAHFLARLLPVEDIDFMRRQDDLPFWSTILTLAGLGLARWLHSDMRDEHFEIVQMVSEVPVIKAAFETVGMLDADFDKGEQLDLPSAFNLDCLPPGVEYDPPQL